MLCHLTNFLGLGQLIVLRELLHREVGSRSSYSFETGTAIPEVDLLSNKIK